MANRYKKPHHIVVVADERENYLNEESIPGVSYLIKTGLNFQNVYRSIRESPYFGKRTVFIIYGGAFSLMKWTLNSSCIESKCSHPYTVLQAISQKRNLVDSAKLLRENFYKQTDVDDLIFCEITPILSNNTNFALKLRGKCQHPSDSLQSHNINLEIDCYNNWVRDSANEHHPSIRNFHLNFNSREMQNNIKESNGTGLTLPTSIGKKRLKLLQNITHYFLKKFNPKIAKNLKGVSPATTVHHNPDQELFDGIIIVANIAYRQFLEYLKSPKVNILASEDLNFSNIAAVVAHYSYLAKGKTLWIFVSGIFSVVEPYINPECDGFCVLPLLKIHSLEEYRSEQQMYTNVKDILLLASDIERALKSIIGENCCVMFSPLIPGQLMNLSNLNHFEQHILHDKYEGLVCTEEYDLQCIMQLYNYLCIQWLGLSAITLQSQGISDDIFVKYSSIMQGSHIDCYTSLNQSPSPLIENWKKFMKTFINKVLRKNTEETGFYKDLDNPTTMKHAYVRGKNLHTKFDHIVFIGSKVLCQHIEAQLTIGTSFIEEDLCHLDLRNMNRVSKCLVKYPENSLFILLFDVNLIAEEIVDNSTFKYKNTTSYLVLRNHKEFSQRFKDLADSELVNKIIEDTQTILNILRKKVPKHSAVIVSPIHPAKGMWVNRAKARKNPGFLQFILKRESDALLLYGMYDHWIKVLGLLKTNWKKFLFDVMKQENLSPKIPLHYINQQKFIVSIFTRPHALFTSKENLQENWIQCLKKMYLAFFRNFSLPLVQLNNSNEAPSVSGVDKRNYETSINDLRQTIDQAKRERKMCQNSNHEQIDNFGEERTMENLVITINKESVNPDMSKMVKFTDGSHEEIKCNLQDVSNLSECFHSSAATANHSDSVPLSCRDVLIKNVNIRQEIQDVVSTIKTEPLYYSEKHGWNESINTQGHCKGVNGNHSSNVLVPYPHMTRSSIKQECPKMNETETILLIKEGHFNLDVLTSDSTVRISHPISSATETTLVSCISKSVIQNLFFDVISNWIKVERSFLPKFLSVFKNGIKNLLVKFPDFDINKFLDHSAIRKLPKFLNRKHVFMTEMRNLTITCPPQEIYLNRSRKISQIGVVMKLPNTKSQKENRHLAKMSKYQRRNLLDVRSKLSVSNNKCQTASHLVKVNRKRKLQEEQTDSVVKQKYEFNNYSEVDNEHQCLILCQDVDSNNSRNILESSSKDDYSSLNFHRKQTNTSLSEIILDVRKSDNSKNTSAFVETCFNDVSTTNKIPSVPWGRPSDSITVTLEKNKSEENIGQLNSITVTTEVHNPNLVTPIIMQLEEEEPEKENIKVRVSCISTSVPHKFIKDLSIACGCIEEPKEDGVGYILVFLEKITAGIFIKSFDGKRIYDSKLTVKLLEGSIMHEDCLLETDELTKCLLHIFEIHQNSLINAIQTKFLEDIDIWTHKVKKCRRFLCNKLTCQNYHSEEDRRRDLRDTDIPYIDCVCEKVQQGKLCPWGDRCLASHNEIERKFHPMRFKKVVCSLCPKRGVKKCPETDICCSVHPGSPDSFYHFSWKDVYIIGLENSLNYLVGSIRMMYQIVNQKGITVLFITPSIDFLNFALEVILPIAEINKVNVFALKEDSSYITSELTSVQVLAGTPNTLWSVLCGSHPESCKHLRAIIIDDVSSILNSSSLYLKMMGLIETIKARRNHSHSLNMVAVGENIDKKLLTFSKTLRTNFTLINNKKERGIQSRVQFQTLSKKRNVEDSKSFPNSEAKKMKLDSSPFSIEIETKSSVLKDKSNFTTLSKEIKATSSTIKQGSACGRVPTVDEKAIDDLLARARAEVPSADYGEQSSKISPETRKSPSSLEKKLLEKHNRSIRHILDNPHSDPDFEKKFYIFTSKYQEHYGFKRDTHHFKTLWKRFWKWHVTEKKQKEWTEIQKKVVESLKCGIIGDVVENTPSKIPIEDDMFSPVSCSSPKNDISFSNKGSVSDGVSCTGNSTYFGFVGTSPHRSRIQDSSFTSFPVTNYKKLFEDDDGNKSICNPLDLSKISEEEYFSDATLSSNLNKSICFSPISPSSIIIKPPTRNGRSQCHKVKPKLDATEIKVEKAVLSLGESISDFSHLMEGFHHVVSSFDNSLSIVENMTETLKNEDNLLLFLIIKDSLEYLTEKLEGTSLRSKYEAAVKECKEILSLASR